LLVISHEASCVHPDIPNSPAPTGVEGEAESRIMGTRRCGLGDRRQFARSAETGLMRMARHVGSTVAAIATTNRMALEAAVPTEFLSPRRSLSYLNGELG
jgi:hypothetical protein